MHENFLNKRKTEESAKIRNVAIAKKNKTNIDDIPMIKPCNAEELKILLKETVTIKTPLSRLDNNKEAEKWVRDGIKLHNDSGICLYCDAPLTEKTISDINAHFDQAYTNFINKIEEQKANIKQLESFILLLDASKFYEKFETEYLRAKELLEAKRNEYNNEVKVIHNLLEQKQKMVIKPIEYDSYFDFNIIKDYIKAINEKIIAEHNAFNLNFENQKKPCWKN